MLRISFLPAGSEDTASSRIRVYSLQKAMAKRRVCATVGFEPESDVVVVQKRVTDEILNLAGQAKKQGAAIVYDVDDLSSALDYWTSPAQFAAILELADLVTTDTAGHREFLIRNGAASRVEIVPDCIDYYPESSCPVLPKDAVPLQEAAAVPTGSQPEALELAGDVRGHLLELGARRVATAHRVVG